MKNSFMSLVTLAVGVALNLVGIVAFMLSDGAKTALIPAFLGGLFLIAGGMALFNVKLRPHAIHGALVLALLLGATSIYFMIQELRINKSAVKMFSFETTAVLCTVYIVLGVRSFRKARRTRQANERAAEGIAPPLPPDVDPEKI